MFCHKGNCVLLIVYIFALVNGNNTGISAAQHAEIAKLRAELNIAYEQHEEENLKAAIKKGVIVQPQWTQGEAGNGGTDRTGKAKVVVTNEGLHEAEALRAEIKKAIEQDAYVVGAAIAEGDHTKQVQALEEEFTKQGSTRMASMNFVSTGTAEAVGGAAVLQATASDNMGEAESVDSAPNVVEATAALEPDIDIRKLQRLELSKRRTREMLVLAHIEEDFSFDLGADVHQWAHIVHNGSAYFVGRRERDLVLVQQSGPRYAIVQTLPMTVTISQLACFQYWNVANEVQEGIIIVSLVDQLYWYRYNFEAAQYVNDWEWPVGKVVGGLTHFHIDERQYLAICSNHSHRNGYYALNIFEYDLPSKEFWLVQRLQLPSACTDVTVLDTGRDILLAVPQKDEAMIYSFNPRDATSTAHVQFRNRQSIPSAGITNIAAFQMGGRSYLALGGLEPRILLYAQGTLHPKTILGNNFGFVEFFLPVPVRTYRDDLLLLVQHRVDFGTHAIIVLETLIWNGEAFEASIPVPCQLGEHTVYGISCMLDSQREEGLRGAALLRHGDALLLLVPRQSAESGLFRLHTQLLSKNSELLDLQEIWSFLRAWVKEQDTLIAQARALLDGNTVELDKNVYQNVSTPSLTFDGAFAELYINDYKWSVADVTMDIHDVLRDIRALEQEMHSARSKRQTSLHHFSFESLEFNEVTADELHVMRVNHVPYYVQNGSINFDGLLNVDELIVLEQLRTRLARQAYLPVLNVFGDMICERINGIAWQEIAAQLIFRNQPLALSDLSVQGEVIIEERLTVDVLNELHFPQDYLLSHSNTTSIIQAEKSFTGTLSVDAVDTDGLINGVNPFDAITLSDPQDWTGQPTFAALEVSEVLELNGTAQGRNFEQAPANPTLLETHHIMAACNFAELIINGPIRLDGNLDNESLPMLLADIAQRPTSAEQEIVINAPKEFRLLELPIDSTITDSAVNGIPITEFIPKHTTQTLEALKLIDGYVYFNELRLSGAYDGVLLPSLLASALRIDEPLDARTTQLNFDKDINSTVGVTVRQKLNGFPLDTGYQTLDEDLQVPSAHFEQLQAVVADVQNGVGISGQSGLLNGEPLRDFLTQHNWQSVASSGNIQVKELVLPQGLEADEIHGIDTPLLMNFLRQVEELPVMILNGQINVDSIFVRGAVQLKSLNGRNFDEDLQRRVVWLNRANYLNTQLTFLDELALEGDLNILGNYTGRNMPAFIEDVVFHSDGNRSSPSSLVVLSATKKFLQDVHVHGRTVVQAINGVAFSHIATTRQVNEFQGNLNLTGRLYATDLMVQGAFNDYPMSTLAQQLHYAPELHAFVLLGRTELPKQLHLQDLTVNGHFGGLNRTLGQFFKDLVYKRTGNWQLTGAKTFTGRVSITSGAHVNTLNGQALGDLLENIVCTDVPASEGAVTVESPVRFAAPVHAPAVVVAKNLRTRNVSACALDEWLRESVRVDQDMDFTHQLRFQPGTLDNNAFYVDSLNELTLSKLVTLHTAQNLTTPLLLDEVHLPADGSVVVHGTVNGVQLRKEYANTLLTTGNQVVHTPLIFRSLRVESGLQANVPLNGGGNLDDVATLHAAQQMLESPLYFQQLVTPELLTKEPISGIDFTAWYNETLWADARPVQWIAGNWSVKNLLVKQSATFPTEQQARHTRAWRKPAEANLTVMCRQLHKLLAQHQGYQLKHLELSDVGLPVSGPADEQIRRLFVLESKYLLVNTGCWTQIYMWQPEKARFESRSKIESGPIDDVATLPKTTDKHKGNLQFLTSYEGTDNDYNCTFNKMQVWRVADTHIRALSLDESRLKSTRSLTKFLKQLFNRKTYVEEIVPLVQQQPPKQDDVIRYLKRPTTESILKPQIRNKDEFSFADFRSVLVSILKDLTYRLHAEVNITQLSIPESDLYDEHLVVDFLEIMKELHTQKLYPNGTFSQFEHLPIPSQPSQVLAVRTVQIIWPVIVEIEEIHGYLRPNETHAHPLCLSLKQTLGHAVRDVLLLANQAQPQEAKYTMFTAPQEDASILNAVIERIRQLQHELDTWVKDISPISDSEEEELEVQQQQQQQQQQQELQLVATTESAKRALPRASEMRTQPSLQLHVGSVAKPRRLIARVSLQLLTPVAANHALAHDAIKLYEAAGDNTGLTLYQSLAVHRPRALTSLRIRDATLLAYVEACCRLHVLSYQGVQGFIDFATVEAPTKIVDLLAVKLLRTPPANAAAGSQDLYAAFVVALRDEIRFYEVISMGLSADVMDFTCT